MSFIPTPPETEAHSGPDPETRIKAIADRFCSAMLDAAAPPAVLNALTENRPQVIIVQAPTADWVDYLDQYLREAYPLALVLSRDEAVRRDAGNWSSQTLMPSLHGRAVIAVSQDPQSLIPPLLLDLADHHIVLSRPDLPMVQAVIIDLTAACPRKLRAHHLEGMSAGQLLGALRPAKSAGAMARRIIATTTRAQTAHKAPDVPKLSELELPDDVASWAHRMAADLPAGKTSGLEHVLIAGPPGVGKTHLAYSLAATAGLPLVMTNAGKWFTEKGGHLHEVLGAQTQFFAELTRLAPAIGVIDEVDSVPNRTVLRGHYDPWWIGVTNGLLTNIDGFNALGLPVLLIGITNTPNRLDPALVRPGRLGRHLEMILPTSPEQRLAMLRLHLPEPVKSAALETLLPFLNHQSQAGLKQVAVMASALAAEADRAMTLEDLRKVLSPSDHRTPEVRRAVALHEAGHAVMAITYGRTVRLVAIHAGDGREGQTDIEASGTVILTPERLEENIRIRLAGRAADIVSGTGPNAGARADLAQTAEMLEDAFVNLRFYGPPSHWPADGVDPNNRSAIVEGRIATLLAQTIACLTPLRPVLEAVADALVEHNALSGTDLAAVLAPFDLPNPDTPKTP